MILRDIELLKEWLIPRLSPICHTDPKALADYIIGLIKKDKPVQTLKSICVEELQVFLMRETVPLVDRLFEVLEGELYIAKGSRTQETTICEKSHSTLKIAEKLKTRLEARNKSDLDMDMPAKKMKEATGLGTKRSVGELMHGHASVRIKEKAKNTRKSIDAYRLSMSKSKEEFKYYVSEDDSTADYIMSEESRKESEDETPIFDDRHKSGRCKDYDERGYCMLGDSCPYDHGSDPVVLEPTYSSIHAPLQVPLPMPLIAPPPILPLNPTDPRLILPPTVTQLPIPAPVIPAPRPISATDGYNPENPAYDSVDGDNTVPISGAHGIPPPIDLDIKPIQSHAKYNQMHSANSDIGMHMTTISNGGIKRFSHPTQLSSALILRKVPFELNTVAKLSNYFEKFGTVVNVQVRYDNDPEGALVRFVTPQEAKKAHDCSDAVLGNRFIRVFYSKRDRNSYPQILKPFEITSPIELAAEAATGPLQPKTDLELDKRELSPVDLDTPTTILSESLSRSNISMDHTQQQQKLQQALLSKVKTPAIDTKMIEKKLEIQKRKQELIDQCLKQQKLLFGMLTKSSSQVEKDRIKKQIIEMDLKLTTWKTSTEQAQALRNETARIVNRSANEKLQELRKTVDKARAVRSPGQTHKDLRGIISRKPRSLLILSIKQTEKEELMTYLERFGIIEQVNYKPDESQLLVTYRSRQEAEKLVHSTYPFKGRNLIMKWSAPKKPLRSQLKYVNVRAHAKSVYPGYNLQFSRPAVVEVDGEGKISSNGELLVPEYKIGFGSGQEMLMEHTNDNMESPEDLITPGEGFASISSPNENDYFNFLEPKVTICDDSENEDEEEVYWRRRDKV